MDSGAAGVIWTYYVLKAFRGEDVAAFERDRRITGHSLQNYRTLRVPEFIAKKTAIKDSQRPGDLGYR